MEFRDLVRWEGRAKLCGGFESEVFISGTGGGDDLAFGFEGGAYASGGYVHEPDFFEPAREDVFDRAGNVDEVGEHTGEFFFVDGHVGFDAETFAGGFEPEDSLTHDGTEGAPLLELEFRVDGFLVIAELLSCHFVGLQESEFDEGSEGRDDDGFDGGGGAGFSEEGDSSVPLKLTWDWLVVIVAKWSVVEPRLIKTLSGFEETDWAVEVVITVENEGFGELERYGSFT